MDDGRRDIVRLNIARYEAMLQTETDPVRIATVRDLLAEARGEASLLRDEAAIERARNDADGLQPDSGRLRMRAEEYRAIALALKSEAARSTYLHLARSYDKLAARADGQDDDTSRPNTG
jgi:hypothetical protein